MTITPRITGPAPIPYRGDCYVMKALVDYVDRKGMSRSSVGRHAGYTHTTLANASNGSTVVRLRTFVDLCTAVGLRIELVEDLPCKVGD